jgi:hypothetical protein
MHAGELILFELVVNMPRKHKPRKPVASPEEVWIAPRPVNIPGPRTFEPIGAGRSNRYLEFADIALGIKVTRPRKKKTSSTANQAGQNQKGKSKVTSIDSHRPLKEGFGAFRNSR